MADWSMLRWCMGAGLLVCTGCFDGHDALGLPCEKDFQCGNGQVCAGGACAWPGDATAGGDGSGSSGSSSGTTGTTTSGTTTTDTTGGTGPNPTCVEGGVLTSRELTINGSGNPMSVGVGRFSDDGAADVVVLTRSPARLSVFRFDGVAFQWQDDADIGVEPMDLAVGSLDDDEYDDVVVVDAGDPTQGAVTLFWGASGGLFSETPTSFDEPLPFPHSVDIGRMLGNATPQFVVSSGTAETASSLFAVNERQPMRLFTHPSVSASPWDTVLVDLNGEPPLEALVAGSNDEGLDQGSFPGGDRVHVLSATAGNGMIALQVLDAAHSPFGVDAGDLDGDGIPEVIVVGKNIEMPAVVSEKSDQPSEVSICSRNSFAGDLTCLTWEPGPAHIGYNNVRLTDLNCDGELDAVIGTSGGTEPGDGAILVAQGPLVAGFVPMLLGETGPIGNKIAIADVTDDGAPDIVVPRYGAEGAAQGVVRVYSFEEPQE